MTFIMSDVEFWNKHSRDLLTAIISTSCTARSHRAAADRKREASPIKAGTAPTCSRADRRCSCVLCFLLSCCSQARDVFAGSRTWPVRAGARPSSRQLKIGSSQATEGLITDPDQGQPCGNCVHCVQMAQEEEDLLHVDAFPHKLLQNKSQTNTFFWLFFFF